MNNEKLSNNSKRPVNQSRTLNLNPYLQFQDEQVRSNIQEIVARLSAELEETSESYKELENDKCDGV